MQEDFAHSALDQQVIRRLKQEGQNIHAVYDGAGNRIAE